MTAPHPEMDALLDAVFDAPDDDTPRLVLADWLTEHGQSAYADFIRLQCAAAREPLWSDEANRLWEEIGRVWTHLDEEWWPATRDVWNFAGIVGRWDRTQGPIGGWASRPGWRHGPLDAVHFERGFLRPLCAMTYRQLVQYSNSCWPWLPLPTMVLQADLETERRILPFPRPHRIRSLRMAPCDDYGPEPLVYELRLGNLEVLDMGDALLASNDAEKLLAPGMYSRLREVRLRVFDADPQRVGLAGCVAPDVHPSTRYLQQLRSQLERRFEKVVWLATS